MMKIVLAVALKPHSSRQPLFPACRKQPSWSRSKLFLMLYLTVPSRDLMSDSSSKPLSSPEGIYTEKWATVHFTLFLHCFTDALTWIWLKMIPFQKHTIQPITPLTPRERLRQPINWLLQPTSATIMPAGCKLYWRGRRRAKCHRHPSSFLLF